MRADFVTSSGFATVHTRRGEHFKAPSRQPSAALRSRRKRRLRTERLCGALLAILIGTVLAAVAFIGLSGGFRP